MSSLPVSAEMVARARRIGEPRWSPDGKRLGYLSAFDGRVDLLISSIDGPAVLATSDVSVTPIGAYGGGGFAWAGDELVVATDEGSLVVLGADGGAVRRVLSDEGKASAPTASVFGGLVAFVRDDTDACGIAVVPLDGSAPARVISAADFAWDPALSPDGTELCWHEWDLPNMPWDGSRIVRVTVEDLVPGRPSIVAGGDDVGVAQPRFAPDGASVAFVSDEHGYANVWIATADGRPAAPLLAEPYEHAEPAWGPGQRSFAWSPDGAQIAWCRNEAGFGRLVAAPTDADGAVRELGRGWHRGIEWGPGGIVAARSGARTPDEIVVYPPSGRRRALARGPVGGWPTDELDEPEPLTWASDGATVHGLLFRPRGVAMPPLLVSVHGGPTSQGVVDWRDRVAFFCARGWAVLRPNHRGSSGYGRSYMRALDQSWGVADVADVAAGIRAVTDAGLADRARVAIEGGSAGGMAVLLLCAAHPELVRAGVSLFGVTDLLQLAAATHRFESRYLDRLVGPLPSHRETYVERSPVNRADEMKVPILVHQGSDDEVVPRAQADAMVDSIRRAGGSVEYHVYEGEGHGFNRLSNVVAELERTAAFLHAQVAVPVGGPAGAQVGR